MNNIIEHKNNIINSSNEVLNQFTINKNLEKLYQNDLKLSNEKEKIYSNGINSYIQNYAYKKNDIVWFKTKSPITNRNEIFILRSIISDNIHIPEPKVTEKGIISFEDSGWVDCQDFVTCVQNDLSSYIKIEYTEKIAIDHQNSEKYHKYGRISEENFPNILLKKDLSNIDVKRRYFHFPYETVILEKDNVILGGQYRKWDCGLIEYDIIFRLGYTGNKIEKNGIYYDEVKCNNIDLSSNNYFMEEKDAKIFNISSDIEPIFINNTAETNHNEYINTYSSQINFPVPFINENYMIFGSQFRNYCQDIENRTIGHNSNSLTYTNRTKNSICPIYITYTKDIYTKSAVIFNNFHCQIIGRWK